MSDKLNNIGMQFVNYYYIYIYKNDIEERVYQFL